jgi:hypothetical protein
VTIEDIFEVDDIRIQCFKYVGAGLATISLAVQELALGIVFGAYLASLSIKSSNGKSIN